MDSTIAVMPRIAGSNPANGTLFLFFCSFLTVLLGCEKLAITKQKVTVFLATLVFFFVIKEVAVTFS